MPPGYIDFTLKRKKSGSAVVKRSKIVQLYWLVQLFGNSGQFAVSLNFFSSSVKDLPSHVAETISTPSCLQYVMFVTGDMKLYAAVMLPETLTDELTKK